MSNIRASLYGRLGGDPKPIQTKTGNAMTRASLAVAVEPYNAEADDTEWVTVLTFGRLADALAKHAKGDMLAVSGRFERTRWTGKDGTERTTWQLVTDDLHSSRTVRPGSGKRREQQTSLPDFNDPLPDFAASAH